MGHVPIRKWRRFYLMLKWTREARRERRRKGNTLKTLKKYSRKTMLRFLFWGGMTIFQGLLLWTLAFLVLFVQDVFSHIWRGDFKAAWEAIIQFDLVEQPAGWGEGVALVLLVISGWLSFYLFGYIWDRFRRSSLFVNAIPIAERITSRDILLYLRGFGNEIRRVRGRRLTLKRMLFISYEWNFSLEEIINERLKFIGETYGMGSVKDKPHDDQGPPPPVGVNRYYADKWQDQIKVAIKKARMIVLIMGDSPSLKEEISWIKNGDYLDKTLFLMPTPPDTFNIKGFWSSLKNLNNFEKKTWSFYENQIFNFSITKTKVSHLNPKKIIGVCFHLANRLFFLGRKKMSFPMNHF